MRQRLGPKKLRRYSRLLGMEFTGGMVRGNTGHRVDLVRADGERFLFWPSSGAFAQSSDESIPEDPDRCFLCGSEQRFARQGIEFRDRGYACGLNLTQWKNDDGSWGAWEQEDYCRWRATAAAPAEAEAPTREPPAPSPGDAR